MIPAEPSFDHGDESALTRQNAGDNPTSGRRRPHGGEPPVAHVLLAYGTLAPGESNHDVVSGVGGRWYRGSVRGTKGVRRSGHYRGFPAFVPDPAGPPVDVAILVSAELVDHWDRLDEFEGPGYRRIEIEARTDPASGAPWPRCRGFIYESIDDDPDDTDG